MITGNYKKYRKRILKKEHDNRKNGFLPYWNDRARSINWKAKNLYGITNTITGLELMNLYNSNKACLYCGHSLTPAKTHIDHLIALNCGGYNVIDNMVISCISCNCSKKDESIYSFILRLSKKRKAIVQSAIDKANINGIRKIEFDIRDYT
jgi:5-methylcytosine-specific restriction endonuclease McrA